LQGGCKISPDIPSISKGDFPTIDGESATARPSETESSSGLLMLGLVFLILIISSLFFLAPENQYSMTSFYKDMGIWRVTTLVFIGGIIGLSMYREEARSILLNAFTLHKYQFGAIGVAVGIDLVLLTISGSLSVAPLSVASNPDIKTSVMYIIFEQMTVIALSEELFRFAILIGVFVLFTSQDIDFKTGLVFTGGLAAFSMFMFYSILGSWSFGLFIFIIIMAAGIFAIYSKGEKANMIIAIVVSSAIWTSMHLFSYSNVESFAPILVIFIYGLFYGALNIGFKSFFAAFGAHSFHNVLLVLAQRYIKQGLTWGELLL
tara:strand:- start:5963 stop:6919 length:957 start_codon:yes stop_codon:yes gene_type:complete